MTPQKYSNDRRRFCRISSLPEVPVVHQGSIQWAVARRVSILVLLQVPLLTIVPGWEPAEQELQVLEEGSVTGSLSRCRVDDVVSTLEVGDFVTSGVTCT